MTQEMGQAVAQDAAVAEPELSNHIVHIRRLAPVELTLFRSHLVRLDDESRYSRFGRPVSDDYLEKYAEKVLSADAVVKACFIDGICRGVGEAIFTRGEHYDVEAAFSLEQRWQGYGLGTLLFKRLIRSVRNRGGRRICVLCLRSNQAMCRIAEKMGGDISVMPDGVVAEIHRAGSTVFSRQAEFFEDAQFMFLRLPDSGPEND